jgi:hypothetical protein
MELQLQQQEPLAAQVLEVILVVIPLLVLWPFGMVEREDLQEQPGVFLQPVRAVEEA